MAAADYRFAAAMVVILALAVKGNYTASLVVGGAVMLLQFLLGAVCWLARLPARRPPDFDATSQAPSGSMGEPALAPPATPSSEGGTMQQRLAQVRAALPHVALPVIRDQLGAPSCKGGRVRH